MPAGRTVAPAIQAATPLDESIAVAISTGESAIRAGEGRLNACYAIWTARQSLTINATVFGNRSERIVGLSEKVDPDFPLKCSFPLGRVTRKPPI